MATSDQVRKAAQRTFPDSAPRSAAPSSTTPCLRGRSPMTSGDSGCCPSKRAIAQATALRSVWLSGRLGDRPAGSGQAVAGRLLFWRRRRLGRVLAALVVDPGLRPRFFRVLPTFCNFRAR
jgi:hypothetical protein